VVLCHHVLHLLPPDQQREALQQLAARLAPGGLLLLSSYSEPADAQAMERVLAITTSRLRGLGMDEATLGKFMAGRNTVVFSLNEQLLAEELAAAGLEPPQQLLQALASRMWISRRP
jgi:tRNA (cmo5U34)-methyltransferase